MLKLETPVQLSEKVLTARKALLFLMDPTCPDSVLMRERLELIEGRNTSLVIAAADVTRIPKLAQALRVTEFPTVLLFQQGKRISHLSGKVSGQRIQELVDSVFW